MQRSSLPVSVSGVVSMPRHSMRFVLALMAILAIAGPVLAQAPTRLVRMQPDPASIRFVAPVSIALSFDRPLLASSVNATSVTMMQGGGVVNPLLSLSLDGRTITIQVPMLSTEGAPSSTSVLVDLDGDALRDVDGRRVDVDGNGTPGGMVQLDYDVSTPMPPPIATGTAVIMGRVFDTSGAPLAGVTVDSVFFPAVEGQPALPVPSAISDAQGWFSYTTVSFLGVEEFLVRVRLFDATGHMTHSETLHRVEIVAGGCTRVPNSFLQPLNPSRAISIASGTFDPVTGAPMPLTDPARGISMSIPPGALQQNSEIRVTGLETPDMLRSPLPPRVSPDGVFTDVEGVFGEETLAPVTFRVPNTFNLPVGERVPFGKVDHNTLEWFDLRDLYDGPGQVPDEYLGTVVDDGNGGTYIEVQFDHFCTICTGYCLPNEPPTEANDTPRAGDGNVSVGEFGGGAGVSGSGGSVSSGGGGGLSGDSGSRTSTSGGGGGVGGRGGAAGPGGGLGAPSNGSVGGSGGPAGGAGSGGSSGGSSSGGGSDPGGGTDPDCGNSAVQLHEGHLHERVEIPGFGERGRLVNLPIRWASYAARPTLTLCASFGTANARPVEGTIFTFEAAGQRVSALYDRSTGDRPRGTWLWDGRDGMGNLLATGLYRYRIDIQTLNADVPVSLPNIFGQQSVRTPAGGGTFSRPGAGIATGGPLRFFPPEIIPQAAQTISDRGVILNFRDSPLGAGWGLEEEYRLHQTGDGGMLLTIGNHDWREFTPFMGGMPVPRVSQTPERLWSSSDGDRSALRQNGATGEFRLSGPDGTEVRFDVTGRMTSISDRHGYQTTYTWQGGLLTRITTPVGNWWEFDHANGRVTRIRDSAGRTTLMDVDPNGNLVRIVDVDGAERTFAYDQDHLLVEQTAERGSRSTYTFVNGRCVAARAYDRDGTTLLRERQFEPQVLVGEVGLSQASGIGLWEGVPNPIPIPVSPPKVDRRIDGRGFVWLHETDGRGRTIRQVDPENRETRFVHDAAGRLVETIQVDGSKKIIDYDAAGFPSTVREANANNMVTRVSSRQFNGPFDLLTRVVWPDGSIGRFTYDARGNLVVTEDANGEQWVNFYQDPRFPDQPTAVIDPSGVTTTITYNAIGLAETITTEVSTAPSSVIETIAVSYDAAGRVAAVVGADGRMTTLTHDARGRMTSLTDDAASTWTFSYDESGCGCSNGELAQITWPNGTTTSFLYDGLGRLVSVTDRGGRTTTLVYDAEDNLSRRTNRVGQWEELTYDRAGQLTREVRSDGTVVVRTFDARGRLRMIDDARCRNEMDYDLAGNLTRTSSTYRIDDPSGQAAIRLQHEVHYTYDAFGRLLSRDDQIDAGDLAYTRDAVGRIVGLDAGALGAPAAIFTLTRDSAGRVTQIQQPFGGLVSSMDWDQGGRLTEIRHGSPAQLRHTITAFESGGRIAGTETIGGGLSLTRTYSRGQVGRLGSSQWSDAFGGVATNVAFTVDLEGRILSDDRFDYVVDGEGRVTTMTARDGSVVVSLTWNPIDQLVRYEESVPGQGQPNLVVSYVYDALNRLAMKTTNGRSRVYLYDATQLVHVLDGGGRPEMTLTAPVADGAPLAAFDHVAGRWMTLATDHLGSLVGAFDDAGTLIETVSYDEYGQPLSGHGLLSRLPYGYIGLEHDLATGLVHTLSRPYAPWIGRFLSEDPLGELADLTLTAYGLGDPLTFSDQGGREASRIQLWAGGGRGAPIAAYSAFNRSSSKSPTIIQRIRGWMIERSRRNWEARRAREDAEIRSAPCSGRAREIQRQRRRAGRTASWGVRG